MLVGVDGIRLLLVGGKAWLRMRILARWWHLMRLRGEERQILTTNDARTWRHVLRSSRRGRMLWIRHEMEGLPSKMMRPR